MAVPVPVQPMAPDQPSLQAGSAVRLVTGFAGFGAGSVNLAISSSIFSAAAGPAATPAVAAGVAAGAWGLMLLAAAVVFLARDRLPGGRKSRYVLAGAAAVHLAAMASPPAAGPASGLSLTHLSALLLTLMILASLGWLQRERQHREPRVPAAGPECGRAGCCWELSPAPSWWQGLRRRASPPRRPASTPSRTAGTGTWRRAATTSAESPLPGNRAGRQTQRASRPRCAAGGSSLSCRRCRHIHQWPVIGGPFIGGPAVSAPAVSAPAVSGPRPFRLRCP